MAYTTIKRCAHSLKFRDLLNQVLPKPERWKEYATEGTIQNNHPVTRTFPKATDPVLYQRWSEARGRKRILDQTHCIQFCTLLFNLFKILEIKLSFVVTVNDPDLSGGIQYNRWLCDIPSQTTIRGFQHTLPTDISIPKLSHSPRFPKTTNVHTFASFQSYSTKHVNMLFLLFF